MNQSRWKRASKFRRANFVIVSIVFWVSCAAIASTKSSDPLAAVAGNGAVGLLLMALWWKLEVAESDPPASWGPPGPKPPDPP
jgi:hypothetical protein